MVRVIAQMTRGVDLRRAIDAPRIHTDNDGVVQLEPGFPDDQVAELTEPVSCGPSGTSTSAGCITVSSDGSAAADARRAGRPDGSERPSASRDPRRGRAHSQRSEVVIPSDARAASVAQRVRGTASRT